MGPGSGVVSASRDICPEGSRIVWEHFQKALGWFPEPTGQKVEILDPVKIKNHSESFPVLTPPVLMGNAMSCLIRTILASLLVK